MAQKIQQFDRRAIQTLNRLVKEVRTLKETVSRRFHGFVYGTDEEEIGIIRALTNGTVEYTDATFAIDTVTVLHPDGATAWPGGSGASEPTVVDNLLRFPAHDDADVIAFYDSNTGNWLGIPAMSWAPLDCEGSGS